MTKKVPVNIHRRRAATRSRSNARLKRTDAQVTPTSKHPTLKKQQPKTEFSPWELWAAPAWRRPYLRLRPRGADVTSRSTVSALFASATTEVPRLRAETKDQSLTLGPVAVTRESPQSPGTWLLLGSRHIPPSPTPPGSLTHIASRLSPRRLFPPAAPSKPPIAVPAVLEPRPPGAPTRDCALGTGDRVRRATEVKRAEPPASLFSAENIFWMP